MLEKIDHKKKFYLLLGGACMLLWLSVHFGFSRTIELKQELEHQRQQLSGIQDAPQRLKAIEQRLKHTESLIGEASGEDASPYLIEKAGRYCQQNKLILNEIPRKHCFINEEFAIVTYQLKVQGSFKKLLTLADELEHYSAAGKLRSVCFTSEYDLRKKRTELFGTYYIQSIGNIN